MDLIDFSFNQTSWCHENPIIVPESSADSIYPGVLRDEVLEMLLPKHIGGSDEKHEINPLLCLMLVYILYAFHHSIVHVKGQTYPSLWVQFQYFKSIHL